VTDPNDPIQYIDWKVSGPIMLQPNTNNGISMLDGLPRVVSQEDLRSRHSSMSLPTRNLESYGATGVQRFSPLKPGVDLGQTFGELLLDGLPQIPLNLLRRMQNLEKGNASRRVQGLSKAGGKDYLGVVFGWEPLLRDIRDMYKTWNTLNSRMAQIIRDNGRPIRRKGTLFRDSSTEISNIPNSSAWISPAVNGNWSDADDLDNTGAGTPGGTKTITTSEEIWFAGRFRYYIPDVTADYWTSQAKLALFGLNPSPSLVYKLVPWSWLIDWFSNVGDVIANFSSNGIADLITDYGYVMRHYREVTQWDVISKGARPTWVLYPGKSTRQPFPPTRFTSIVLKETKERIASTPFGFGLQIEDLSDRQLAILAALGLSRNNFRP
jgi:hypothetical protein